MYNEKGMILVEALVLLMITTILVGIILGAVQIQTRIIGQNQRGFHDDIIYDIYQNE